MLAAQGPKSMRLAARHADIWSCFAEARSDLQEFGPRIAAIEAACEEVGRDPVTIGRSAGLDYHPLEASPDPNGAWIGGPAEAIADQLRAFRDAGYSQVALFPAPATLEAIEASAPVLELLRADERLPAHERLRADEPLRADERRSADERPSAGERRSPDASDAIAADRLGR